MILIRFATKKALKRIALGILVLSEFTRGVSASAAPADAQPLASAVSNGNDKAAATSSVTNASPRFVVRNYRIQDPLQPANTLGSWLSTFTGTNVALADLARAAADLQSRYRSEGITNASVAIAPDLITNGVVTVNVFRGSAPQILIAGKRYSASGAEMPLAPPSVPPAKATPVIPEIPATAAAAQSTNEVATTRTNTGPHFTVRAYAIRGDTLLSTKTLMSILPKYTGTNVTLTGIMNAASDLQMAYRNRGYPTVNVTIPQQRITNGIVHFHVFEGRLADIIIAHNEYFSSNNIMRALPSLRTNIILNRFVFQAELDRANANRDRQIYPTILPGPVTNTSSLLLEVKDRLPLHWRLELNNQSTPQTPDLRMNGSLVYNNLWQHEHSLGLQYSFSPEATKDGDQWNFYDRPLIANYSAYYRMPLSSPQSVGEQVETQPGQFGYNEATHQFRLPPPSGRPDLTLYASRATIDTGVQGGPITATGTNQPTSTNALSVLQQQGLHQDLTINEILGLRLNEPLGNAGRFHHSFSIGLDFKTYRVWSYATNRYILTSYPKDINGNPLPPVTYIRDQPINSSAYSLSYLPFDFGWNTAEQDKRGSTTLTLNYSANFWYSGSRGNLDSITASTNSTGHWLSVKASLSREQSLYKNWKLLLRADGQWASEPLISNEQFGIGGLAGVRGYREGEVFGDTGWRITSEPRSPPFLIGDVFGVAPMYLQFSLFMDYGQSYLLDPQGRPGQTSLWGTGGGLSASIGSHWSGSLALGVPLLDTLNVRAGDPRFYFSLGAQF